MNILQKIFLAAAFTAPLTSIGCKKSDDRADWPTSEQWQKVREDDRKRRADRSSELAKSVYPLEKLRHVAHGIHLFDENRNEVLEPNEIDRFIKIQINNETDKFTEEGKKKFSNIIDSLYKESWLPNDELITVKYRPNNITKTLENFDAKLKDYDKKYLDQIDAEIQSKINRLKDR